MLREGGAVGSWEGGGFRNSRSRRCVLLDYFFEFEVVFVADTFLAHGFDVYYGGLCSLIRARNINRPLLPVLCLIIGIGRTRHPRLTRILLIRRARDKESSFSWTVEGQVVLVR